jgi:4-hydroxybenzoate polyprenyltransferase
MPHMKGTPLLGSALHVIGGLLHFLLGYSLFAAVDARGLEIGCYFGLTFAAGHLTHEARDHDADLPNGIRTNAVTFGRTRTFVAGLALFTMAYALLVLLAARGTVPRALMLVAPLYILHLHWSLQALRVGLTFDSIRRLQVRYRTLYAAIGLMMVATGLLGAP